MYSFTPPQVPDAAAGAVNKVLNQRGVLASIFFFLDIGKTRAKHQSKFMTRLSLENVSLNGSKERKANEQRSF